METAREIFENMENEGSLELLISENTTESLYLEFKQKEDSRDPVLSNVDKNNFANALSQFANSDGGVLVFGIKTKKPNDSADKLKPIQQIEEFRRRVHDFTYYATQPFVDDVQLKIIESEGDSGYLVCLIPRSDSVPHRSAMSREYYKRGEHGKYRLEHFDLEDMFGRRQKPKLRLEIVGDNNATLSNIKNNDKRKFYTNPIKYRVYIHNDGRYVGKNVMIIIKSPEEHFEIELINRTNPETDIRDISDMYPGEIAYQVKNSSTVYYPEIRTSIADLYIKTLKKEFDFLTHIQLQWAIYAEDMVKQGGEVIFAFKDHIDLSK